MGSWFVFALFGLVIVVGVTLLTEALLGFVRASRGIDDDAVARRISSAKATSRGSLFNIMRAEDTERPRWSAVLLENYFHRLITQSGKSMKLRAAVLVSACLGGAFLVLSYLALPGAIRFLAFPIGIIGGPVAVLLYFMNARSARIAKFEEQLPEAIDLAVRSLKVGHPLSVSLSIIASEMPAPIGQEFALAHDKVSYGLSIPDAFKEMSDRVPLADLRYLVAALQIQEEAGGNLVESLTKLAAVIRERFRMFRKVKAVTAEGRMSAWLLSLFPVITGLLIRIVKPDYFDKAFQAQNFQVVAVVVCVLLVLNVVVMNAVTKIKV